MATTSIWRVGGWLGKVVIYVENPDKTENPAAYEKPDMEGHDAQGLSDVIEYAVQQQKTEKITADDEGTAIMQRFVSGVNCSPSTARDEMMAVKKRFGKEDGTVAYHGYQSFAPGEATSELAHEIGLALAKKLWGEKYQVLVATHLDRENHLHNHFVLNTVSFVDGIKYHRTEQDYFDMQRESDRLCREMPEKVISGLKVLMRIFGLKEGHIGIEDNKPEAVKALKAHLAASDGVTVDVLPAKYPQGAEKQLIYAITGRQVPSGGLPAAVGCAVFNAATCKAIHDAVYDGMPLISRVVTVSGDVVMEPKNLMVPIGTSFNDLVNACGHSENPYKVLSGGPMMGAAQYDLAVPVIKGVNAVTVLGKKNEFAVEDPRCLRCGKCIDACPMKLMPVLMYKALQSNDVEEMKANNVMDCIECGCCAYTCPASVPLVLGFKVAKQLIRNAAAAAKK